MEKNEEAKNLGLQTTFSSCNRCFLLFSSNRWFVFFRRIEGLFGGLVRRIRDLQLGHLRRRSICTSFAIWNSLSLFSFVHLLLLLLCRHGNEGRARDVCEVGGLLRVLVGRCTAGGISLYLFELRKNC